VLQFGLFVAPVAPWHHTHRVRSWQGWRGGQNPGGTTKDKLPRKITRITKDKEYKFLSMCSLRSFAAKFLSKREDFSGLPDKIWMIGLENRQHRLHP
jgi:hypothetical protein